MISMTSQSHQQTFDLGARLGEAAIPGTIVALQGELGSGKTVFAKGVGKGLALDVDVTSPTYVILQLYPQARIPLVHVDLYRIVDEGDVRELGVEELLEDNVTLIEWFERCPGLLPEDYLFVRIEHAGPTQRRIEVGATGPLHQQLLESTFG